MNSDLVGAFLSTQFKMCFRLRSLETSHYGLKNVLKEYSYSHTSAFSPRYLLKNLNFFVKMEVFCKLKRLLHLVQQLLSMITQYDNNIFKVQIHE